jgi:hypothetical protein
MLQQPYMVKRASGWVILGTGKPQNVARTRAQTKRLKSLGKLISTNGQNLLFKVEKIGLPIQFRLAMFQTLQKIGQF